MIKIILCGATGRVGTLICELAQNSKEFVISGQANRQKPLKDCITSGDVIIDFSLPEATETVAKLAAEYKKPLVIGTTGLGNTELALLKKAAEQIPVVYSANMSIGVNLLFRLIETATQTLGSGFQIDIEETHHIHKKDKPSGTAKSMGDVVTKVRGTPPPIESKREGEVIGEHTITFRSPTEKISLSHSAIDRKIFAEGALRAAQWIRGKKAGLYTMIDVLKG